MRSRPGASVQGQELPQLVLSWDLQLIPEPTLSAAWPPHQAGVLVAVLPHGAGCSAPNKFSNQTSVGKSQSSFKKWLGLNQGSAVLSGQVVSWCFD